MVYLFIVKRCELYGFSAMQTKYIIIIEVNDFFTHFWSCLETIHDGSASQLEVLVTWPTLLVEKPKRRKSFQNTIQSE